MNIIIHRGTHQIGGSAIEISTASTRIILDFGNELSLDEKYTPINLDIDGVTKGILDCDGIVISHYHMDHLGQLTSALPEIPLYMGELSKEVAIVLWIVICLSLNRKVNVFYIQAILECMGYEVMY